MEYLTEFSLARQICVVAILFGPYSLQRSTSNFQALRENQFFFIVIWLVLFFYPYLSKKSKYYSISGDIYRTDGKLSLVKSVTFLAGVKMRPWSDNLITTSLVYFLPAIYGAIVGEYHMAFLCFVTCVGSSIYHRNREAIYFNLDNIFATSLLVSYCWSLYLSYGTHEAYFMFGLVGIPVAIFLLVYCGMPAEISMIEGTASSPFCCMRSDRPLYNSVHALWHLASGCGPLLSVWLFATLSQAHNRQDGVTERMVMGSVESFCGWSALPLVPSVALLAGVLLNLTGNILEVMPME